MERGYLRGKYAGVMEGAMERRMLGVSLRNHFGSQTFRQMSDVKEIVVATREHVPLGGIRLAPQVGVACHRVISRGTKTTNHPTFKEMTQVRGDNGSQLETDGQRRLFLIKLSFQCRKN